jgi:hypothetical protein
MVIQEEFDGKLTFKIVHEAITKQNKKNSLHCVGEGVDW